MEMNVREDIPEFLNSQGLVGYGAEIGVLAGTFSSHILKNWQGHKLYLIDSWRYISGKMDLNNRDHNFHLNSLSETFMNVYKFGSRATIIREKSSEASILFQDDFFDFIYLDATHDYPDITTDLYTWYPKVKIGGYLMGHDYLNGTYMDTEIILGKETIYFTKFESGRAVDDFAKARNIEVKSTHEELFKSWYFQRT